MVEVLLGIVIVGLVGFIGWSYWSNGNNKRADVSQKSGASPKASASTETSQQSTEPQSSPVVAGLAVTNLGIRIINLPQSLRDVSYNEISRSSSSIVDAFSTVSLAAQDGNCSADNGGFGALTRHDGIYVSSSQLGEASPDTFVKQLNGFWISYAHPQAICAGDSVANQLWQTQMNAFSELVLSPANIQQL